MRVHQLALDHVSFSSETSDLVSPISITESESSVTGSDSSGVAKTRASKMSTSRHFRGDKPETEDLALCTIWGILYQIDATAVMKEALTPVGIACESHYVDAAFFGDGVHGCSLGLFGSFVLSFV